MSRLRHVIALACLALACTAGAAEAGGPPAASAAAGCSTVSYEGRRYVLYKRNVKCDFARRWVKRLHRTKEGPAGWDCSSGSKFRTGGYCERGSRYFGWHPGD